MKTLYNVADLSRQALHQWQKPSFSELERTPACEVIDLALQVRKNYLPGSGARELYKFIRKTPELSNQLKGWGKHHFERLCLENGFRVISKRFIPKTTQRGSFVFPNLIAGTEIKDINRIWVSDISYIHSQMGKLIGYATSLIDLYSRRLLGLSFSENMTAEQTAIAVIKQGLKQRKMDYFENLIFHSDGGKQYIDKLFLSLLANAQITSSMAENCLENGYAEAFNDTLKNHILAGMKINSYQQLSKQRKFIIKSYNTYKGHSGIDGFTPIEYENHILTLKSCQRTTLKVKEIL